jgi:hypothetical protein
MKLCDGGRRRMFLDDGLRRVAVIVNVITNTQ